MSVERRRFLRLAGAGGRRRARSAPASGRSLPWPPGAGRAGSQPVAAGRSAAPAFLDVPASQSGITWVHDNAMSPERYLPETMRRRLRVPRLRQRRLDGPLPRQQRPVRLLHAARRRSGTRSTRTTATARSPTSPRRPASPAARFGMGVAVGDYDNDGYPDLLVTAYGRLHPLPQQRRRHLHRRHREGRPRRRRAGRRAPSGSTTTTTAGSTSSSAASSSSRPKANVVCGDNKLGRRYYCIPRVFKPTPSLLFHNNGDGTFTDVSKGTDIERALGKALGVVATDINNDGLMDLFVANDTVQNFLFVNRGKGKWEEIGLAGRGRLQRQRPAALRHGRRRRRLRQRRLAGPVRRQRRPGDVLALQEQRERVVRRRRPRHTASPRPRACCRGWGLKFFDYDNDGHLDLLLANGHPDDMIEQYSHAGEVQGAAAAVPQRGRQAART